MMHRPILINTISLFFTHKRCFEQFSSLILPGSRIGVIGKNGSGKSSLLKMLAGLQEPSSGTITIPEGLRIGYVPQLQEKQGLSGAELFHKALTQALALAPELLILDEPTNHLDKANRSALLRMLKSYRATLVIASHDLELLSNSVSILWDIDNGAISISKEHYKEYLQQKADQKVALEQKLANLAAQKKKTHDHLMKEQERARKSKSYGKKQKEQKKWTSMQASAKASQAEKTSGKRSYELFLEKETILQELALLPSADILTPTFSLESSSSTQRMIISITEGEVGYKEPILRDITFSLTHSERVAITGANGSGKSTFVKAIRQDPSLNYSGTWHVPYAHEIGYLDQQYATLPSHMTVFEALKAQNPLMPDQEVRKQLNLFLFRKNGEIETPISRLSGGERARLSLALIAAHPPKLLILDEISNNLDRETVLHCTSVLQQYKGPLIIISHNEELLNALALTAVYEIKNKSLSLVS